MNRRAQHLTLREEEILPRIRGSVEGRGETLSVREPAAGMSGTASVDYHLKDLERRGALVRDGRGWRSCRLPR
ncbi:LexA family transcriptional regulator [Streptomyces sp. NPDC005811]|uniref:LexA family protein n=1 Tax=Streptomyces sp. NPDC005811 TaxID=3154565 RepID=UPI00340E1854